MEFMIRSPCVWKPDFFWLPYTRRTRNCLNDSLAGFLTIFKAFVIFEKYSEIIGYDVVRYKTTPLFRYSLGLMGK
jgi:hypothetical protein